LITSIDGQVFGRHIIESRVADDKFLFQEYIVAAIQFTGKREATNPRICWQKQMCFVKFQFKIWLCASGMEGPKEQERVFHVRVLLGGSPSVLNFHD